MDDKVILLVEDNADDEALTLRALTKNNIKNEVIVAHDGVEALDYLFGTGAFAGRSRHAVPQLVLLDLKLPRIDGLEVLRRLRGDRKSTRLNSSHLVISYAVFCLKKKKNKHSRYC